MGLQIPTNRFEKAKRLAAGIVPAGALMLGLFFSSVAGAAPMQQVYYQGFETDTSGWQDVSDGWAGTVTRVNSADSGMDASEGDYYALMTGEGNGPFSRFDEYRDEWTGDYVASVDVYLDPSWDVGSGFDYSVASNGSDGNHQRDFIFHVAQDESTGDLIVAADNNTNFTIPTGLEDQEHAVVTEAGWYTFQHVFRDDGGVLAVDMNLLDADGNVIWSTILEDASDTIPDEVGGNRYAWFTTINVDGGLAVDAHALSTTLTAPTDKEQCKDGGWMTFSEQNFKNQGQCVSFSNHSDNKGADDTAVLKNRE